MASSLKQFEFLGESSRDQIASRVSKMRTVHEEPITRRTQFMDDGIEIDESHAFPFAPRSERCGEVSPELRRYDLSMSSLPSSLVGKSVFVVFVEELAFLSTGYVAHPQCYRLKGVGNSSVVSRHSPP